MPALLPKLSTPANAILLPILHFDDDYVAIHKPAGLLVHRSSLDAGETRFALQILRDQLGREVFPCHRLDKPTSGVLLFALNPDALRRAQAEFEAGRVRKTYLAIVRGWTATAGCIDYPLGPEHLRPGTLRAGKLRDARTRYRRLAVSEIPVPLGRYASARFSLLELEPETGRTHQIRRHLHHISHPIIGDTRHGDGRQNRFFREQFNSHRLLLVATRLRLGIPGRAQPLDLRTDPDADFCRAARAADLVFDPVQ